MYNIIEQHENKEMSLIDDKHILIGRRMRRIAGVVSQALRRFKSKCVRKTIFYERQGLPPSSFP